MAFLYAGSLRTSDSYRNVSVLCKWRAPAARKSNHACANALPGVAGGFKHVGAVPTGTDAPQHVNGLHERLHLAGKYLVKLVVITHGSEY
jgi:hypothetical protein